MTDAVDDVDVETVRERLRDETSIEVDEDVLSKIEERTTDGRIAVDAFEAWYDECEEHFRAVEDRTERLQARLEEYRESLDPVEREFDHVTVRFAEYDERFDAIRDEQAAVAERIETASRTPASAAALYETARLLSECGGAVHGIAHELEHVEEGLDQLASWLSDPAVRLADFDEELDTVERYLDNTDRLLTNIETHASDPPEGFRPFDAWLTARHLHLLVGVVFEELRADVDELAQWLERTEGDYEAELASLRDRLDSFGERHEVFEGRIDDASDVIDEFDSKHAEVAAEIERFETELAAFEPPIDWATLERRIDEQFDELGISLS